MLGDRHSQRLLAALANSKTSEEVADAAIDALGPIFHSSIRGVFFLDAEFRTIETNIRGMRDVDFDEYERAWRPLDRVLSLMLDRQVPTHNAQVYSEPQLKTDPIYADYGRRVGVYRYMCAPLYGSRAELHGMLRVCRGIDEIPFGPADLGRITALGGYISSALARVTAAGSAETRPITAHLTHRELEIARLAASGRNNREIALHLGVARETVKQTLRRVYQRIGVRCRAEMAVWLARQMLI
jgi:DNA-binding CsgD family transcriptional regulator